MFGAARISIEAPRRDRARASRASAMRAQDGFTLFEVLIAAVVLAIGLIGLLGMLDTAMHASASTRAREGATNLAREILEDARTLAYAQISPTSIVGQLQSMNGLANTSGESTWQITRRGVTYTVKVSECAVDDPKDGWGKHVNSFTKENPFCKDPGEKEFTAGESVEDSHPENFKRITAEVSWSAIGRKPVVKQVETLSQTGSTPGLTPNELKLVEPTVGAPTAPVITKQPAENKLTFAVQSPSGTGGVQWFLDGVRQTNEPTFVKGTGTEWRFSWSIPTSEVSDGTYKIGVQAVDSTGVYGPPISISVTLIRSTPAAPKVTYGGFDEIYVLGVKKQAVELQWQPNTERNVIGYRVHDPEGELVCPTSEATLSTQSSCLDKLELPKSPTKASSNLTYTVSALYYGAEGEALGKVLEGPAAKFTVSKTPQTPAEWGAIQVKAEKSSEGAVTLTWSAPVGGPTIAFYRIYRGSKDYTGRYATVSPASTTFTDTKTETAHEYWVTAVSETLTEGPFLGPVTL